MSKEITDKFLFRFKNKIETVGKDGVIGIINSVGLPKQYFKQKINNNIYIPKLLLNNKNHNFIKRPLKNISFQNLNKSNIIHNGKKMKIKKILPCINFKKSLSQSESLPFFNKRKNNNGNESANFNNSIIKIPRQYSYNNINHTHNLGENNLRYFKDKNNDNENKIYHNNSYFKPKTIKIIANNRQNILANGFIPYTLDDYKKINNDVKLGKLGPNLFTEEWEKKRAKMNKMNEYGYKVMHEGKGCYIRMKESADQIQKKLKERRLMSGKWNLRNEYSNNILNSRNTSELFKKNVREKLMEEKFKNDNDFKIDWINDMEEAKVIQEKKNEIYRNRLDKMKDIIFDY